MKLNIKNLEFHLVKFPVIFPIIYFVVLYSFPQLETELIFITILLLAETHFGATWPFFLDRINGDHIKKNRISLILIPIIIVILSFIGFIYFKSFFLLIFFAANVFHVTRQSYGICKLYCKFDEEKKFQEILIYFFNSLFFIIAFLRFYIPVITEDYLLALNFAVLCLLSSILVFYLLRFKYSENFLIFFTGSIIFYPACFVSNPVHAIIMGVTMHYTQYLFLTHYVYIARQEEKNPIFRNLIFNKYFLTIIAYSLVMSILSIFGKFDTNFFKQLILIPIVGQIIHFYLDSQLWKFSIEHNRNSILKYINNLKN